METLEVHSKDFLIKWVNVPESSYVDWQVKPLKRSINFSIYKKNDLVDDDNSQTSNLGTGLDYKFKERNNSTTTIGSTNSSSNGSRVRSSSVTSVNRITEPFFKTKSRNSTLSSNIDKGDLSLVKNYDKLISDELVKGKLDVESGGIYAFIFDNSFSKTTSKKVLFSTKIIAKDKTVKFRQVEYPSPVTPPNMGSNSQEDLSYSLKDLSSGSKNILTAKNGELVQGLLLKKRRKKLQGFTKRYFILNVKYSTLSYFKVNDNKLRGQMPINQSIISANAKKLEIIIDSGMEIWDLKALNKEDFDIWVETFNSIKKHFYNSNANKATFHSEVHLDDSSTIGKTAGLPSTVIEDLNAINMDVINLMDEHIGNSSLVLSLNSISNDINKLILKVKDNNRNSLNIDSMSLFSSSEYYDAKDHLEDGVNELDDDDDFDDDFNDAKVIIDSDASSSSSEESSSKSLNNNLSVITETISHQSNHENTNDNDNNLYPLPLEPVERPLVIPEWNHPPSSLLSFFRKNVGKDLTSIAMPVDMNEPVTILQKYAELVEYCDLINNALQVADQERECGERILRIAAFAVSSLSSVRDKERNVRKPFNPLLGETFELVREDKGIRLISEKVSHRPPVFATFVESKDWTLSYSLSPSQKFWGKTAEINNKGTLKLTIKSTGEIFTWNQPPSMLKNIIAGEKYSEPSGTITIKSSTGKRAVVEFAKSGMFSGRSEELTIDAFDGKKKLPYSVFGKWTESLTLKTNTTERLIWTCGKLLPDSKKRFGFTQFANDLVQVTQIEKGKLSPTDSRLRPDIKAYLAKDIDTAETVKCDLEESQRTRRKEMEQSGKKHKPAFFHHIGTSLEPDSGEWIYSRGEKSYWNRRVNQDWEGLIKLW